MRVLDGEVVDFLKSYFGEEKVVEVLRQLVFPPKITTVRVNTLKISKEEAKKQLENLLPNFEVVIHETLDCLEIPWLDNADSPSPLYPGTLFPFF